MQKKCYVSDRHPLEDQQRKRGPGKQVDGEQWLLDLNFSCAWIESPVPSLQ